MGYCNLVITGRGYFSLVDSFIVTLLHCNMSDGFVDERYEHQGSGQGSSKNVS